MIKAFQDAASDGAAELIRAWLVHTQRDTVQDDDEHADSFEPREFRLRKKSRANFL